MKTFAPLFTLAVLAAALLFSLGSVDAQNDDERGERGERSVRTLSGFDSVHVHGGVDVRVRQDDDFLIEVYGPAEDLITELNGSTLEIHPVRGAGNFFGIFNGNLDLDVAVTLPELKAVWASGGSDVNSVGTISGETMEIGTSGGSDLTMQLQIDAIEVSTSGGSDVNLSGEVGVATLNASGGSDLNARDLSAREVQVQSSGGSDTLIDVSERLYGKASGGSDVIYTGNPSMVDVDVSGGADLTRR